MFTFIELQGFSKRRQLLLPDDEFRAFPGTTHSESTAGDIIAGTGSFRKIRWNRSGMGETGWHSDNLLQRNTNGRIYLAL
ncbi:type II toxin-antitoxin system RelE/ParE family toxin [Escherichia coli]|nr:type II toxin-antitoxin system RelE/ParE family toxin [Escherichia coli]